MMHGGEPLLFCCEYMPYRSSGRRSIRKKIGFAPEYAPTYGVRPACVHCASVVPYFQIHFGDTLQGHFQAFQGVGQTRMKIGTNAISNKCQNNFQAFQGVLQTHPKLGTNVILKLFRVFCKRTLN